MSGKRPEYFSPTLDTNVDYSRWISIYPVYLDATKTLAKGRRIPKEKAVPTPTAPEVFGVVKALGFDCVLEGDKSYSRDCWVVGRIRTKLFDEHHRPIKEDIPSRRELMTKIAARIPQYRQKVGQKAGTGSSKKSAKSKSKKKK